MPSDGAGRDPPHNEPEESRRSFVKWAVAAGAGVAALGTQGCPRGNVSLENPLPVEQPPETAAFEVVTTNGPVSDYDKRPVFDRAEVKLSALDEWRGFRLVGEKSQHQFNVRARNSGWFTEVELELVLHGNLQRRLTLRNRSDLMVKRLWLSSGYYHGDSGRACFSVMAPMSHFATERELWFASIRRPGPTVNPRDRQTLIERETTKKYSMPATPSGTLRLELHDGVQNVLSWRHSPDGRLDSKSTWFRGAQRVSEVVETTFLIPEARTANCHASRMSGYCDTDDI